MRVRVKNARCGPRLLACDPSPAATYSALIVVCEPRLILHYLHCHQTLFIRSYLTLFSTGSLSVFRFSVRRRYARCCRLEWSWQNRRWGGRTRGNDYDIRECVSVRVLSQFYQVRQKAGASSWSWLVIPLWETFGTQRSPVIQSDIHTSVPFLLPLYYTAVEISV